MSETSIVAVKIGQIVRGWKGGKEFTLEPDFSRLDIQVIDLDEFWLIYYPMLRHGAYLRIMYMSLETVQSFMDADEEWLDFFDPDLYTVDKNGTVIWNEELLSTRLKEYRELMIQPMSRK